MVRVVIDLERLKFLECGLGQFSLHLGRAIAAEANADFQPVFLVPPHIDDQLFDGYVDRIELIRAVTWRRTWASSWLRPLSTLWPGASRASVWHVTHQDSKFWPINPNARVILTIHDLNFLREKSRSAAGRRLRKLQWKVDRATALTTGSHYAAEEIGQHLDVAGKRIHVIPHGVCLRTHVDPAKPETVKFDRPFLFTIGDVTPKKNFHVLVDLMARLPEYGLIIAGNQSGDYARRIESRIAELNLKDRVCMPGRISESERSWLFKNCEAFVFPSLSEGFGLPVIEAMSFGKPVFCSNRTSLPEVGGSLAFYWESFDPASMAAAFRQGIATYREDSTYGERLRRRAAEFDWSLAARRYVELYHGLISPIEPRRPMTPVLPLSASTNSD